MMVKIITIIRIKKNHWNDEGNSDIDNDTTEDNVKVNSDKENNNII